MAKIALITGANRGLGFETARQLGRTGIGTIIGARDAAKGTLAAEPITRLRTTVTRGDGVVALEGTAVCYTAPLRR